MLVGSAVVYQSVRINCAIYILACAAAVRVRLQEVRCEPVNVYPFSNASIV